jgi:hypothetical protein
MNEELKGTDIKSVVPYYENFCVYTNDGDKSFRDTERT